jgi:hypothetical protein
MQADPRHFSFSCLQGSNHGQQWGLHVELSIVDLTRTQTLQHVLTLLPNYVSETWLATVHQSHWDF